MPQVTFTSTALRDLERLREFLRTKNAAAAKRAAFSIIKAVRLLEMSPYLGRHVDEMPTEYRELAIDFGDTGYLALYRYEGDKVTILSIRHQKEGGY